MRTSGLIAVSGNRQPARVRRAIVHALALACYGLMAFAVTYPMPMHLGERIIANQPGQVDGYLGIWNIWWAAYALVRFQDPFVTPLLFHPQGLDLFWQTLSLPQGLLALPVTLTVGPLPAYNLLILLSFILGGYFAFLFIRAAIGSRALPLNGAWGADLSALVGGAVYAFAPFHMQKVLDAQLEVASVQWLPLWALSALLLLERRRWPWALLSGALLLWVGLGTWYYGLFALIAAGLLAGLWAIRACAGLPRRPAGTPASGRPALPSALPLPLTRGAWCIDLRVLLWGLAPIAIWFAAMAPRLIDLARSGDRLLGDARVDQVDAAADLLAFWLPNPNHPLWGAAISRAYLTLHPDAILWNVSLGLVGTALALVGVAVSWRRQWRWLALGVAAASLALGAEVVIGGWRTGLPGPYALIRDLPGVRSSHRPNHMVLVTILTTALFAAEGLRALLDLLAGRVARPELGLGEKGEPPAIGQGRLWPSAPARRRAIIAPWSLTIGLLLAIVAIDGWAGPPPLFQRPVPRPYLSMPTPDGALLPVPLHLNFSNSENLWYQTFHHWPIIGGFIGREPPYPLGRYAPGVKELRFGQVEQVDILTPGWPALARETLAAYGIRAVMFHHEAMGSPLPLMRAIVAEMGLEASYQDELITVYPVPEPALRRPLAYLGAGWGDLEQEGTRRWRWMGEGAEIYLLNPTGARRPVALTLDAEAYARPRTLSLRLGDGPPFTLEVSRERARRTLRLMLPPGETVLYLGAPAEAPPGQPGRRLSLAVMGIVIE